MAVKFANRMNLLKGSEIRALLALTAKPEVISFAGGMPAPELFPTEAFGSGIKTMDQPVKLRCLRALNGLHLQTKKSFRMAATISM